MARLSAWTAKQKLTHWAGNLSYSTDRLHEAASVDQVRSFLRSQDKVKVLGTRHCFNSIADSRQNLLSLKPMHEVVALDAGGRRQGGLPEGASVEGRVVAARIGRGKSKEWLYLFTPLALPREEVLALYGKRWRIETDLRSLKTTVRLHHVAARNESMMGKELLTAVAAYNLVRAVTALAARRHHLAPRQLSFTFVLNVVNASWHRLQSAADTGAYQREVLSLLAAAQGLHPKR